MNVILCFLNVVFKYSTWTSCILNSSLVVVMLPLFRFTHKEGQHSFSIVKDTLLDHSLLKFIHSNVN
jgi:hypothetical protein